MTAVSTGGSGGEDRLTENVTLNFEKIHFDYWTQDDKGAKGESSKFKCNIAENIKKYVDAARIRPSPRAMAGMPCFPRQRHLGNPHAT